MYMPTVIEANISRYIDEAVERAYGRMETKLLAEFRSDTKRYIGALKEGFSEQVKHIAELVGDKVSKSEFNEFKGEMYDFRKETKLQFVDVRSEIGGLRTEVNGLRTEFAGLRSDFKDMRTEINDLRTDFKNMQTDLSSLRTDFKDMRVMLVEIRKEIKTK